MEELLDFSKFSEVGSGALGVDSFEQVEEEVLGVDGLQPADGDGLVFRHFKISYYYYDHLNRNAFKDTHIVGS